MVIDEKSEDRWRFHPHIVEYLIQIYKSPYQDRNYNMTSSSEVFVVMLQNNCWDNSLQSDGQNDTWEHSPSLFLFSLVSVEIAFLSSTNSTRSVQPLESSSFRRSVSLPMPEEMGAPVFTFVFWLAWSFGVSECVKLINIRQKRFVE